MPLTYELLVYMLVCESRYINWAERLDASAGLKPTLFDAGGRLTPSTTKSPSSSQDSCMWGDHCPEGDRTFYRGAKPDKGWRAAGPMWFRGPRHFLVFLVLLAASIKRSGMDTSYLGLSSVRGVVADLDEPTVPVSAV